MLGARKHGLCAEANTILRIRSHVATGPGFHVIDAGKRYGWITQGLSQHKCKDDRDRVYAALHLLPRSSKDEEVMKPDYTLPVVEVYSIFSRIVLAGSSMN